MPSTPTKTSCSVTPTAARITRIYFSREFERRLKRHSLPPIRLHDLRHTYATLALEAGVPAKVVADRLGHSSVMVTLDLYSHVMPAVEADHADPVGSLISRQAGRDGEIRTLDPRLPKPVR